MNITEALHEVGYVTQGVRPPPIYSLTNKYLPLGVHAQYNLTNALYKGRAT